MPSHRIVLGVDGSAGAQSAVRWCASYAGLFGARVMAIHVVSPAIAGALPPLDAATAVTEEELARLAEALEDWCTPMRDAPVSYETRVVRGVAAGTLMQLADEVDALMVVVGRRGDSGLAELVLGSVPRTLTHQCARPVLVVPG
jgi:nucleotide-binding universal stress UspA family protein